MRAGFSQPAGLRDLHYQAVHARGGAVPGTVPRSSGYLPRPDQVGFLMQYMQAWILEPRGFNGRGCLLVGCRESCFLSLP